MLVEMATFGRKKKLKTALLFALHEKASVSEGFQLLVGLSGLYCLFGLDSRSISHLMIDYLKY